MNPLIAIIAAIVALPSALGCSRILENKYDRIVSGRSMEWVHSWNEALVLHPRGQEMGGGAIKGNSVQWVSKYGSVVASIMPYLENNYMGEGGKCEGFATIDKDGAIDGINEAGLGAHLHYLGTEAGTEYKENSNEGNVNISYLRWIRYLLDNFATVEEAIEGMDGIIVNKSEPCWTPNHMELGAHIAIQDSTGDSAIIEHIGGSLQIYHGRNTTLAMTNAPAFPKHKEMLKKYSHWGGDVKLPGELPDSTSSMDRFVRLEYYIQYSPEPETEFEAIANLETILSTTSMPFGASHDDGQVKMTTMWNSFHDLTDKAFYFKITFTPNMIRVGLDQVQKIGAFDQGRPNLRLQPQDRSLVGDVLCNFLTTDDGKVPHGCSDMESAASAWL